MKLPSSILISSCFFFVFFPFLLVVSAADIFPGASLSASNLSQTWASPNKDFSLGFIRDGSAFFAAITYGGVPVWKAGGDNGAANSTATLQFLADGNLRLVNGSSSAVVWQSNTAGRGVVSASLYDSGNFVLWNGTLAVWSTFENPTDAILPDQNLSVGKELRSGLYSFTLHNSGNLTLRWNSSIVYWNSSLNSSVIADVTSPTLGFKAVGILSISDPSLSTSVTVAYSSDYGEAGDILRFLRLDNDGNLRIYSSQKGSGNVTVRWAAVSDQCRVFGYCGNYGICSYSDSKPVCGCPSENFEPNDPKDGRKGCKRKVEIQDCSGSATMLSLEHSYLLTYPPELSGQVFYIGISACKSNCLSGPSCLASTSLSDGSGMCYIKDSYISGYQSPALPSTSYVKVCPPLMPNPPPSSLGGRKGDGWRLHGWIVALVVLGTILGLIMFEGGLWWWFCRKSPKFGGLSAEYALLQYASGAPVQFSYKELLDATKGFKEKLGAGGFGAVYRGVLANKTVVAVKQLEGIQQGEKQFRMEVATISSTHHLNLVRLIGFCSEGRHRLLVYEFMENGSLDNFLFAPEDEDQSGKWLDWEYRFNIAVGTARGITYLHEECRDCIVHCDVKPENILLDVKYNAKVSDFGLAKLINPRDHRHHTLKSVRGTRGYLAPEWLANMPITSKSDVYSYGMVLLEIVSGRRNFWVSVETNGKKFSLWAYEQFEKGNLQAIVDKRLAENGVDMEQVTRAIKVSFWCIQEQPAQRPTMGKVVQMLEGVTEVEKPPIPKAMAECPISGTSVNVSSIIGSLSTSASSAPDPSLSPLVQTQVISSSTSRRNLERASSSLLQSEQK